MNVFEKLQSARVELQECEIKKSGSNKFSGYDYFELGDILPHINILMNKYKLCSSISYGTDIATLTITNSEKLEEKIIFTSPMAQATLKGCHDIQNLGAVQSYLRRYLYLTAFEIVEADVLDATTGKENKDNKYTLSVAQINRLFEIGSKAGKTPKAITETAIRDYKVKELKEMTKEQYDEICSKLEALGAKK